MANVDTGEISIWIGKNDDRDYQYSDLAWSPNSQYIVLSMRVPPDFISRGLWMAQADVLGGPMIAQDPNYLYDAPKWDLWGNELIFQQEKLKGEHTSSDRSVVQGNDATAGIGPGHFTALASIKDNSSSV